MVQKQGHGQSKHESQTDVHMALWKGRLQVQELRESPHPVAQIEAQILYEPVSY